MIRFVIRTLSLCVMMLTLAGCFQATDSSPLVPTNTPAGGVAQNPTAVLPTVEQPVNPTPDNGNVAPTQVIPTEVPVQTDTPISVIQPTQVLGQNPTDIPTTLPTIEQQQPTPIPPTAIQPTPIPPTQVPAVDQNVTITPLATNGTQVGVGPTISPTTDGATGILDAACNYHVEQDDRLLRIALRFHRTLDELIRANPSIANIQLIYVGQLLKIPDCNIR